MFIPTQALQLVTINEAKPSHLLISATRSPTLYWIGGSEADPVAIALAGNHDGLAFPTSKGGNSAGVLIGPVELRLDPTSAHDGSGSENGLLAANGRLTYRAKMNTEGFEEMARVPVGEMSSIQGQAFYFTRWSLGHMTDRQWSELVRCDEKGLSGPLVPKDKPSGGTADL